MKVWALLDDSPLIAAMLIYRTDIEGLDHLPAALALSILSRQAGKQDDMVLVVKVTMAPVQIQLTGPDQVLIRYMDDLLVESVESSHAVAVAQAQVDTMIADNVARAFVKSLSSQGHRFMACSVK